MRLRSLSLMTIATLLALVEPVRIGPEGLPELTLGWQALAWTSRWLRQPDGPDAGQPWKFTTEQARFMLWWYAVSPEGRFVYRSGVLRRMKGWGKDPVGATLCAFEFVGPCRFARFDQDAPGGVVGKRHPAAWIQTAAVSKDQTRNTMTLFPGLFSADAISEFGIDLGKEIIYSATGGRIEAVTSSPRALEGGRSTFVLKNEPHHWVKNNDGHAMAQVIARNAAKARDGSARSLSITNAHDPNEDSVAQHDWEAWQQIAAGKSKAVGFLYDSLEAPASLDMADRDQLRAGLEAARGDSVWLDVEGLIETIYDPRTSPAEARRFYLNQVVAAEDAWVTGDEWDACGDADELEAGTELVLFFDGSKSGDATGLVGCRVSDGAVFVLGLWERPREAEDWQVPRDQVDGVVDHVFAQYKPVGFFADPGSGEDDHGQRYWDGYIDGWGERYGDRLTVKAVKTGDRAHAVLWDMRTSRNTESFTSAAERTLTDIVQGELAHDGDPNMRRHVLNARRRPNRWGVSIGKEHRSSLRKVDLAVCMVGARMVRRLLSTAAKKPRSGRVV